MNDAAKAPVQPAKGVFIDNRWQPARSGRTVDVFAPAEGAVFAQIGRASCRERVLTDV